MDDRVKGLLNRVRDTAQQAGQVAGAAAQEMKTRAGSMVDVTRLNLQIHDLQNDVNTLLKDAGQIIYDAHLGVDTDEELLGNILARLDEKNGQIMELRARIDSLKSQQTCPCCGAPCAAEDHFCKACGAILS